MMGLAWHTARARATSLAGSFVALALGVGLLAGMALTLASTIGAGHEAPRWYVHTRTVIAGNDTVSITTGTGDDRETESETASEPQAVPAQLSTVDPSAIVDYAGYAASDAATGDEAHPWSSAALHDYAWQSGGAPRGDDQIVLTAPASARPGDMVTLNTREGPKRFTVSGVLTTSAQPAFYVTDPVASNLADGRIRAIATNLDAATVAKLVGAKARVLTGNDKRYAEPDPDADKFVVAVSLLGTTCGLAGFVSVFVVAGTFGYAVAARRREFGLLRTAGATPRQVRRLVLGEAVAVGALASSAGGVVGTLIAPPFAHWLAEVGFAPHRFTAHFIFWPVAAAFGVGMLVAVTGAMVAAHRAGRVRPIEALREAAVDRRAMTLGRWLVGLAAFGGSVPVIGVFASVHSADGTALILAVAMLLIIGFTMFAPLLIPPLVALLTAPLLASRGAVGLLARRGAVTAVRRTAATVAPILVTVGIAGATLAAFATLTRAGQVTAASRVRATAMVAGDGIADPTVAAIQAVPGVTAAVPVTDTPVYLSDGGSPDEWQGRYVNGPDVSSVLDLPVVAGTLNDLTGTGTVAVPQGQWRLGDTAHLWLGDSAPVDLRVVAVLADQIDLENTVLLPMALRDAHTAHPLATSVYLRLSPDASLPAVDAVAATGGGALLPAADYLSAADAEQEHANRLATIAVLGMALVYTAIAIANTLVMATGDRRQELATLRLSGATPGQVLRMIGVEAVLVTAIGVLLAGAVTAVTLLGMRGALAPVATAVPVVMPWPPVGGIAATCLAIAVLASLIPAALMLRRRPVELAGVRE
jgi:putative ABC transport system permease protein